MRAILTHLEPVTVEFFLEERYDMASFQYYWYPCHKITFESQRTCIPLALAIDNSLTQVLKASQNLLYLDLSKYQITPQTITMVESFTTEELLLFMMGVQSSVKATQIAEKRSKKMVLVVIEQ